MLKECLRINYHSNTCSSVGYKSDANQAAAAGNRSRAAVASFRNLLHAVRSFYSSSSPAPSQSPLTLPRSLSRRLFGGWSVKKKKRCLSSEGMTSNIVVVKDILRWKSFRDLVEQNQEEEPQPLDLVCTGLSLNEAESGLVFTADESPCWWVNAGEEGEKENDVVTTDSEVGLGPQENNDNIASEEEKEQHSPVTVLDSPFRDEISDEEFLSSFDQSLADVEGRRQRLLESIQWLESLAGVHEEDTKTQK